MSAQATFTPDLDLARRFIAKNPPPGEMLLCALTGSHIYGFSSGDSDLDLKGVHYAHTRELLGFGRFIASLWVGDTILFLAVVWLGSLWADRRLVLHTEPTSDEIVIARVLTDGRDLFAAGQSAFHVA